MISFKYLKTYQKQLIISISTYFIMYIAITFITWEIENPFKWLLDMPTYSVDARFVILLSYSIYHGIVYGLIKTYENLD